LTRFNPSYLLGLDVGTTSVKAVITDLNGRVVAECSSEHELTVTKPGWAEENPICWWKGVKETVKTSLSLSTIDPNEIVGIGVSGQIPTLVLVDKNGEPTRNAILYSDSRAIGEMRWMKNEIGDEQVFKTTGFAIQQQFWIPKLLWLRRHDAASLEKAHKILGSYDFIKLKLSGEFSTDLNNALEAGLLDFEKAGWWTEVLNTAGISLDLLPDLSKPHEVIGEVSNKAAEETGLAEGTPIVAGSGDTVCSALSASAVEVNDLMLMYGTTGCFVFCVDKVLRDPRFYFDYHVVPGMYALNGCMATSGILLRWFRNQFCQEEHSVATERGMDTYAVLDSKAEAIEAGSEGLIILPYFMGEKTPINDPHARGVIFGLTTYHTKAHAYRALLEAVAYGFNHQVEILRELGCSPKRMLAVNGGARSKTWRQIVTDVIGLPQAYPAKNPGAPQGVAFIAGIGTRYLKDWNQIREWVKITEILTPNQGDHNIYTKLYRIYRSVYEHLRPDFMNLREVLSEPL